jgi:thiol-disulfide isomerase/thioredoxin
MMMTRIVICICFFLISFLPARAQFQITIEGSFPGAAGQTIRLMEYTDQISYNESEIAAATADQNGVFTLSFSRFETQYVFFRIDHARMGMFAEPGKHYQLRFEPVNFATLDDSRNPYLDSRYFNFEIIQPEEDLNYYINTFDGLFEDFLLENFSTIHRTRNRQLFHDFRARMDAEFEHVQNPYFQNYYIYKFAYYSRIANIERIDKLTREYIFDKPVLYQNTQYMNFFNTVFETYIFAGSRRITISDLRHTVNQLNSNKALMDSLGKDTLLRNEVIRELVMLKGLQDMYDNPEYRQGNVKQMLEAISTSTRFPQHRTVASNILVKASAFQQGTKAPPMVLTRNDGSKINVSQDFKGKFVYIGFWATWCETCHLDLLALDDLYGKYNKDVVFITISTDRDIKAYERFIRDNPIAGESFHFNSDFRLLDAYGVRNLPLFLIIDPQGNMARYPAPRPTDNIIHVFERLIRTRR